MNKMLPQLFHANIAMTTYSFIWGLSKYNENESRLSYFLPYNNSQWQPFLSFFDEPFYLISSLR